MELYGRKIIYSDVEEVTRDNVLDVLINAKAIHSENSTAIKYLDEYCRGKQTILERVKEVRPEIKNTAVENHALEILNFKTGYFVGEPIQYIAKSTEDKVSKAISEINSFMEYENKSDSDEELVDWLHICGVAYRLVLPDKAEEDEAPFEVTTLEPGNTFMVYHSGVGHKKLAGVYGTISTEKTETYTVYTPKRVFEIVDGKIASDERNPLGMIPIVEYTTSRMRMGVIEPVIPLLDAINNISNNRLDGIEQFIQSLAVAVNCNFDDGVTANDIREAGMIVLKSVGENKADFKILSEQLNQSQTQTLKDDLYQAVLKIVGMPAVGNANTSDSSNNGAVILRNGWQSAEARAKSMEHPFKSAEREFLKIVLRILRDKTDINIKVSDVDIKFTRRCYEDIYTKTNVLTSMLNTDKIHPRLAYVTCGLFADPEEAYQLGEEYKEQIKKEQEEAAAAAAAMQGNGAEGVATDGTETDENGGGNKIENPTGKKWSRNKRSVKCVETGEVYESGIAAERALGIARGKVSVAAHGGGVAGGYHWEYVDGNAT